MSQLSFFDGPEYSVQNIELQDGELLYIANFLDFEQGWQILESCKNEIKWEQARLKIYGKEVLSPRLSAWYGDKNIAYRYSGTTFYAREWTETLLKIKNRIEIAAASEFNSVLLNLYRDGNDSMGWHADDEPELGKNPIIASLSLGDSRIFQLKHKTTKEKKELELTHGSLLIMKGSLQQHWKHQIPKTKQPKTERLNMTFRRVWV